MTSRATGQTEEEDDGAPDENKELRREAEEKKKKRRRKRQVQQLQRELNALRTRWVLATWAVSMIAIAAIACLS